MRIATILLAIPLVSLAAGTGRVERCNFDLRAPSRQIALHATEGLDTAVEASIRSDGTIPDLAGWRLLLWYGDVAANPPLGVAFTNISLARGVARWDIPGAQIATNGRFTVQIVGSHTSGRSEEWARGWLAIDRNSASSFAALTFGTSGWALTTNVQAMIAAEAQARAAGDTVAMTNWQARVNALTNGVALGASALQPPATNTLAAAAAHAATVHSVTQYGGFQAGDGASADQGGAVGAGAYTTDGGAVGNGASTGYGGAVGASASADYGGAVGYGAQTTYGGAVGYGAYTTYGGAVGSGASTEDGGAVGLNAKTSDGFAGGKDAFATTDGTHDGDGIDAIQLGTGGNTEPFTLQVYGNRLLNADGTIPVARLTLHNTDGLAHEGVYLLRTYTNAVPVAGNTLLTLDGTNLTVTGATYAYTAQVATDYWLSIAPTAPAYHYSLTVYGTNACTLSDNMRLIGTKTVTGTNCVAFKPFTNGLWEVMWGGK